MSARNSNLSFGSGADNPDGLQLKLTFDEDTHTVYGEYRCPPKFQSEANVVHPGVLSVILDEIMGHINSAMNFDTTTGELTIRYLQPAAIGENLYLRGWFVKKNRRIVENRAEIENEIGKIVARGKGKYIEREET
jgi:acyl-coenzyme A thioesterase PaaI-like protein